jgi:peptidyl-prolyl cis-trans isomerase C
MKVGTKLVLLIVCLVATTVFAAAKPAKDAKMTVKDANVAAKEAVKAPAAAAPEKKITVTAEVKAPAAEANVPKPAVEPNVAKPTVESLAPADPNAVAATVNGIAVTEGEIYAKTKPRLDRITGQIPTSAVMQQYVKRIQVQAMDILITEKLLDEEVKKANLAVSDGEAEDKIKESIAKEGMTMDSFKTMLQSQGQNIEQVKKNVAKTLIYEKLIDHLMGGVSEANDAEARAYFEENQQDYNTPEQVQASHILVKVEPTATPEEKAKAKEKIDKLLKQVKEGGDFATLAKENSDCPSKDRGGDLGFFGRGAMVKPFEDAAFGMQVGQVSDVVETQFGYHIIKVTNRKEAGLTPFEKAKPDIVKILQDRKKTDFFRRHIEKLKAEAKIVYSPGRDPNEMLPPAPVRQVIPAPQGAAPPAPTPAPPPPAAATPN